MATFSLRTRRAAQPHEGRGVARVDLLPVLPVSQGLTWAWEGWVGGCPGFLFSSAWGRDKRVFGVEGQACHAGSLRPSHAPRCRRMETSSPLCTQAHSDTHLLPHSLLLRSLSPTFPHSRSLLQTCHPAEGPSVPTSAAPKP